MIPEQQLVMPTAIGDASAILQMPPGSIMLPSPGHVIRIWGPKLANAWNFIEFHRIDASTAIGDASTDIGDASTAIRGASTATGDV